MRYKSTYARVLDSNRKFLQAASRYHDLSQSSTDVIQAQDLLIMLGRAATCAVLAPSGPQRHRVLGLVSLFLLSLTLSPKKGATKRQPLSQKCETTKILA